MRIAVLEEVGQHERPFALQKVAANLLAVLASVAGQVEHVVLDLKCCAQVVPEAIEAIEQLYERRGGITGISLLTQAVQDVQIDSRVSRTQYQYTLQDADEAELDDWATRLRDKLRTLPELIDVASDDAHFSALAERCPAGTS